MKNNNQTLSVPFERDLLTVWSLRSKVSVMSIWFVAAIVLMLPRVVTAENITPLKSEEAFKISQASLNEHKDSVTFSWDISDGYYLYTDRLAISSDTLKISELAIPKGKTKDDPFLGKTEILTGQPQITVKLAQAVVANEPHTIKVKAQGCAESGYCYPPFESILSVSFVGQQSTGSTASSALFGETLFVNARQDEEPMLPADEAFAFSVELTATEVIATWEVAEGYRLYKAPTLFNANSGAMLGAPVFPPAEIINDPELGDTEAFSGMTRVVVPVEEFTAEIVELTTAYQGCAISGFCYPPQEKTVSLKVPEGATINATALSEQDRLAELLSTGSVWFILLTFFAIGLGLAFTPCVLPMLPILASIIAGEGKNMSARKAFLLSGIYVLVMATTYAVAGVFAAVAGQNLQAIFQHPGVIIAFAGIFLLLALSMFGFYELQLPMRLRERLHHWNSQLNGGSYLEAAIMGFFASLIVSPCLTPALAGSLLFISNTGDSMIGGSALFAMGLGMGTPLMLFGLFEGALLPKAGEWMHTVKQVFGVLLVLLAIWILDRVVPGEVTLVLLASVLIVSAVFMGAFTNIPDIGPHPGWRKLWKGIGWVMLLTGSIYLAGAMMGAVDPLRPLAPLVDGHGGASGTTKAEKAQLKGFEVLNASSIEEVKGYLAQARQEGKIAILDFYADWCASCVKIEKSVLVDPAVVTVLSETIFIKVDVTTYDENDKSIMQAFKAFAPPTFVIFDKRGYESGRLVGDFNAAMLLQYLR